MKGAIAMRRYARTGCVAVLFCGFVLSLLSPRAPTHAATTPLPYKLFLGGVSVTPASQPFNSQAEIDVVTLINEQRRANNCPPVALVRELSVASKNHSQDMADNNFFSHTGSNGSSFSQRARAAGYAFFPSGEIIAAGYSTPRQVVDGWMNSDGHRRIILTCANDDIGVGLVTKAGSRYTNYWTAVFGQR
jgi:uncharacterized protein YkwD